MTPMRMDGSWARARRPPRLATAKVAAECLRSARREVCMNLSLGGRLCDRPVVVRRQYFARPEWSQRALLIPPPAGPQGRDEPRLLRNLEELAELRLRERRIEEFECDRVRHYAVDVGEAIRVERRPGMELAARQLDQAFGLADLARIELHRLRARVHPLDGFPVSPHEVPDRVFLGRERRGIDDLHPHGLIAHRGHVAAARDQADFALLDLLEAERRRRPADG